MRMPFGKHKGQPLSAIPLTICSGSAAWSYVSHSKLVFRKNSNVDDSRMETIAPFLENCKRLAATSSNKGYRVLSKKAHPDADGSHEQMVALNEAIKVLKDIVQ